MSPPHTFPCHSGLVSARCRGCEGGGGGGDTTSRTAHVTPSGRGFNDLSLLARHGTNNFSLLLGLSIFFIYLHGRSCRYMDICCQLNFDVSIFFCSNLANLCGHCSVWKCTNDLASHFVYHSQ